MIVIAYIYKRLLSKMKVSFNDVCGVHWVLTINKNINNALIFKYQPITHIKTKRNWPRPNKRKRNEQPVTRHLSSPPRAQRQGSQNKMKRQTHTYTIKRAFSSLITKRYYYGKMWKRGKIEGLAMLADLPH